MKYLLKMQLVELQRKVQPLILLRMETQPLHHVISQLIYAVGRHQVSDVWIAGRHKLRGRVLLDMDADAIVANARQWRERIAGIEITSGISA